MELSSTEYCSGGRSLALKNSILHVFETPDSLLSLHMSLSLSLSLKLFVLHVSYSASVLLDIKSASAKAISIYLQQCQMCNCYVTVQSNVLSAQEGLLKEQFDILGNSFFFFVSCWGLDETIDTTLSLAQRLEAASLALSKGNKIRISAPLKLNNNSLSFVLFTQNSKCKIDKLWFYGCRRFSGQHVVYTLVFARIKQTTYDMLISEL